MGEVGLEKCGNGVGDVVRGGRSWKNETRENVNEQSQKRHRKLVRDEEKMEK